jgi:glutathione S-transferase
MLTLYYAPGSSSFATHIALNEVGATFDAKPISLADKEQKQPGFLAINAAGKVPILLIDERPLTEVAGILFYIARQYPDAGLLPPDNDVEAQAQVISWMSFVASGLHPVWSKGPDVAMLNFEIADQRLGDKQWVVGNYSIADIHLFRLYWRFSSKFELPTGSLPNLKRHHDQVLKRPAVIKTMQAEALIG